MSGAAPVALPRQAVRLMQASAVALLLLAVAWELWLAPLRPGGSWLVLKALPLAILLPRLLRVDPRGVQWAVLLMPFYVAEASMRLLEPFPAGLCAIAELVLALVFFVAAIVVLRPYKRRAARPAAQEPPR